MNSLFYKPLIIRHTNVLFWSDTHFGHACEHWPVPLWQNRGFTSVQEHDETLISRWNEKVTNESIVFHLGDFMFGMDGEKRFVDTIRRLNFKTLYVMPGNHNTGWRHNAANTTDGTVDIDGKLVVFTPNYLEAIVQNQSIAMSHYALCSWNGQGKGSWMLHGHSHGSLHRGTMKHLYEARTRDLGVECYSSPATFDELNKEFSQDKTPITFDHHDRSTQNSF
jgi:calcineurin-like phosphoesterase family protein